MTKTVTLPDEAELEPVRALVRELHEAIKDARALLREVEGAKADVARALQDEFDTDIKAVVTAGLERYQTELNAAIEKGTKAAHDRFDTLADLLLAGRKVRTRRNLSLEELAVLQLAVEVLKG